MFKRQPKEIILSALARTGEQAPAYLFFAFVFTYGSQVLQAPRNFLLTALIAGCAASLLATPLSGYVSDLIGRKRWYLIGSIAMGIFGFIYFAMLNSRARA